MMSSKSISSQGIRLVVVLFLAFFTQQFKATETSSCGQKQLTYQGYIFHGDETQEGDWPWHAAIFRTVQKKVKYICGGTVISENFVITAAHCTMSFRHLLAPDDFSVILGLHNKSSPSVHSRTYEIIEIIRHESFNFAYFKNDIALLKTDEDITYSDYIQPICLWPEEKPDLNSVLPLSGTVVGWDLSEENLSEDILQRATLSTVDHATCLKNNPRHFKRILSSDSSNYCAGNKNKTNVCEGNSGGGMYFNFDNTWYIRGITSVVIRDDEHRCAPQQYTTFTDIPFYLKWIGKHQEVAKKRNLLNLGNCGLDSHNTGALEKDKPIFLQYPWTALLEFKYEGSSSIMTHCNGALVHPRFVITAGYCVDSDFEQIKLKSVRLGEYDRTTNPDKVKHFDDREISTNVQSIGIDKVIKHPDFSKPHYDNNLALLKLKYSADINKPNVKPICIPTLEDFNPSYTITGWKRVGSQAHLLTRNTAVLESSDVCKNIYQKMKIAITDNMLCGTYYHENIQDCFRYMSGAPLQYVKSVDRKNRYFLKGLFSFGFPICQKNYTDVFTSIYKYTDWIAKVVEEES